MHARDGTDADTSSALTHKPESGDRETETEQRARETGTEQREPTNNKIARDTGLVVLVGRDNNAEEMTKLTENESTKRSVSKIKRQTGESWQHKKTANSWVKGKA
jgi:hypothetical protein